MSENEITQTEPIETKPKAAKPPKAKAKAKPRATKPKAAKAPKAKAKAKATKPKAAKAPKKGYTFNYSALAAALLKKRFEEVISQRDAAAQVGISQPQFYKMELGHETVSVVYFLLACTWLNKKPDNFINQ